MKFSKDDHESIEILSAISGESTAVIKHIFQSLMIYIVQSLYSDKNVITIPYLGEITIDYFESNGEGIHETAVKIGIESSDFLRQEIQNIINGNITSCKKFIQKNILLVLQNKLEIEDIDWDIE